MKNATVGTNFGAPMLLDIPNQRDIWALLAQTPAVPHFRSLLTLAEHIRAEGLSSVDSSEWQEEWADRWVVYADLIAFASRTLRSEKVVLNNILRFDRASSLVADQFDVTIRRFSDATFGIASTFHRAIGFATALSHACLAFNREILTRNSKPFFIHMSVPRITIAHGRVLLLPQDSVAARFKGINRRDILAGAAIVKAHQLERHSAGGLVTIDTDGIKALMNLSVARLGTDFAPCARDCA